MEKSIFSSKKFVFKLPTRSFGFLRFPLSEFVRESRKCLRATNFGGGTGRHISSSSDWSTSSWTIQFSIDISKCCQWMTWKYSMLSFQLLLNCYVSLKINYNLITEIPPPKGVLGVVGVVGFDGVTRLWAAWASEIFRKLAEIRNFAIFFYQFTDNAWRLKFKSS